MKKKFNMYLKKVKLLFTKYVYTNRLFLTYLFLTLCGSIILRNFTIAAEFSFKPLFTDLGLILIIGALGYFIKPKNQFKYFFTWIIIFTLMEVVNSVYYTFYASFASFSELATLGQAETVTDSIIAQLRLIDFIYILQPIIFYNLHNSLRYSSYYNLLNKVEKGKVMVTFTLLAGLVCLSYSLFTATRTDYSRLSKQWNRNYVVERFGIIMYQFNDIFQTIKPKISSLFGYEEAKQLFDEYFLNREKYDNENRYTGILEGYNIVYVHMESMQNFLMNLKFNGKEVTPNLNDLARDGMFFSNFYPQVSTGTSSDAEYMMLTGLLPASSGTVFVNYSDNVFNTIATNLTEKGYYTFSMHGNYASMWNRSNVHPKLGYQAMYYRDTFTFNEESDVVGLGINDKMFFNQAVEKLKIIESTYENYFGTIITLSNHSPFAPNEAFTLDINDYYTNEFGEQTSSCYLCNRDIGKYIVSSHYADEALGEFLNYIKNSDNFNNTVFVFYGDHDAKMSYRDMNYLYNYDYLTGEIKTSDDKTFREYDAYDHALNKKTPLILWSKNKELAKKLTGEVDTIMGMYDAIPTLYNMLDIETSYVLGHDIFNIKDENIVVYPNGNYLTDKVFYNNSTGEYKILKEGIILESDYVSERLEYAELTLDVGNAIVMYDLFNDKKAVEDENAK